MYHLQIKDWSSQVGLFPMPLFRDKFQTEKFILLNGGMTGDVCIDFNNLDIESARNFAWSSDVGHYLAVDDSNVNIYNWDTYKTEKYPLERVQNNLIGFYEYLKKQNQNKQESIIKFCIQLYRKIRTLLRDNNGIDSLNTLLYLFACAAAGNIDRANLPLQNWHLPIQTKDLVLSEINDLNWEELNSILNTGLVNKGLKPDIELVLRHASGSIFQEAHSEILFSGSFQTSLFGLPNIDEKFLKKRSGTGSSTHFTPTAIVRTIVEQSLLHYSFDNKKDITVFDPACGSGEFLKEFVRQLNLRNYSGKINIVGWDISETAISIARFIINYEVASYKNLVSIDLIEKDSLSDGKSWDIKADFILMNPPFVSWDLMSEIVRKNVTSILGDIDKGKPNTAGAFLWNAINCLANDGIIGCVLPASIFENDSYKSLRKEMKKIIDVKMIGRLGSHHLFPEAIVDTSIFLGSKHPNDNQEPLVFWSDYKSESNSTSLRELRKLNSTSDIAIVSQPGYSLYKNPDLLNGENWMPIPRTSYELLKRFKSFPKVEDVFNVMQGARTGLNSVFIVSKGFYSNLTNKEKKFFRPAVANESINKGTLNDSYYVFYPHSAHLPKKIQQKDLEDLVPIFYKSHLQPNEKKLLNRKGINEWWEMTRPRAWQKAYVSKIVSKEFGKAGDFAFDKEGIYVAERSHAWLPKKDYVFGEIGYAYVCVLSMPIINDFLAGLSKQIAGGQWYLASKFINKMPLPNLFDTAYDDDILEQLVNCGIQISAGEEVELEILSNLSEIIYNA